MLAVACRLRQHIKQKVVDAVDARPSPPHFYCFYIYIYIYNTIVRLSIVSIFIHVYFLVKPLEIIF